MMKYQNNLSFARDLDRADPLKNFRKKFLLPKNSSQTLIYFAGNSLGLQPINAKKYVNEELEAWGKQGVEGHLHSKRPWFHYHKFSKKALAKIVGAKPIEVVAMNGLTVNLHLMLVSFYRPTSKRFKILAEAGAFPSDQYALESHLKFHNLNPDQAIIELKPRDGEFILRTGDILEAIEKHADELALVYFAGVQYYSGQLFEIRKITEAAHQAGAYAAFDLAHAVGNVPLSLHKDNVDFAIWCSYKYLNSGPGGVGGAFVHERHAKDFTLPRFAGWWGHNETERFQMKKGFKPMLGVDGWQISNFPILSGAAHLASLEIFEQAGTKALWQKSQLLTGYLEFLLWSIDPLQEHYQIITPSEKEQRGCQLSIFLKSKGKKVFEKITKAGVVADWREPNVIRVAPVPLYNTFEEVFRFGEIFKSALPQVLDL
jgi:kynureninase